jgi:hypothetical protein
MAAVLQRQEREYDEDKKAWIIRTLNPDGTLSHRVEPGQAPKIKRRKPKPKEGPPRPRELTDQHVEALRELMGGAAYYPDSKLPGLFIYIGPRKAT